jgi:hypothetical protein
MLVQCEFVSGASHTVGYVEDDRRLRVGAVVTLKDGPGGDERRRWTITRLSDVRVPRSFLKRGWNNNI